VAKDNSSSVQVVVFHLIWKLTFNTEKVIAYMCFSWSWNHPFIHDHRYVLGLDQLKLNGVSINGGFEMPILV
jgi:hypothetical protein